MQAMEQVAAMATQVAGQHVQQEYEGMSSFPSHGLVPVLVSANGLLSQNTIQTTAPTGAERKELLAFLGRLQMAPYVQQRPTPPAQIQQFTTLSAADPSHDKDCSSARSWQYSMNRRLVESRMRGLWAR
jgi:hypothetical protein